MTTKEVDHLIRLLSKIPGLGPRSARRSALHLIKNREKLLRPLGDALKLVADKVATCITCGNFDTQNPCSICADQRRDAAILCVVEDVSDLWAIERTATYKGLYHIIGGVLSPLDGIGPDDLNIAGLVVRATEESVKEVVLATSATVDGKTTSHYISDNLRQCGVTITALAHGIPVGGELDFLDDGTLSAAIRDRRST